VSQIQHIEVMSAFLSNVTS